MIHMLKIFKIIPLLLAFIVVDVAFACEAELTASPALLAQRRVLHTLADQVELETARLQSLPTHPIVFNGRADFLNPYNRHAVQEILSRLENRLAGSDAQDAELMQMAEEGRALLATSADATPYRATVEWVFRYIERRDLEVRKTPPAGITLTYFHTGYGRNRLKELLNEAPSMLLVFDFGLSPLKDVLSLQAAAFKVVAVNETAEFADAFWLSPAEAAYHDVGHAWLSHLRDKIVAKKRGMSLNELHRRGQRVNRILNQKTDQLQATQPQLASALTVYRFEVHHERGMPVDLRVLQDETNTTLRVASLRYKITSGFFGSTDIPEDLADRVDQARLWLQNEFQSDPIFSSALRDLPVGTKVQVQHYALAIEGSGTYVRTLHDSIEEVLVEFLTPQGTKVISKLQDVSLAQIEAQNEVPADALPISDKLDNYDRFRLRQLHTIALAGKNVPFIIDGPDQESQGIYLGRETTAEGYVVIKILSSTGRLESIPLNQIRSVLKAP